MRAFLGFVLLGIAIAPSLASAQLVADFSAAPTSGSAPLAVSFTDLSSSSASGGVTSWAWDFDTDGFIDSTTTNPLFIYTGAGIYTVSLTVTDIQHPADRVVKPHHITVGDPVPKFTVDPVSACEGEIIFFDETTYGAANEYQWTYGDGIVNSFTSSIGGDHARAYSAPSGPGEYLPELRVMLQPPPSVWSSPFVLPEFLTIYPCSTNPKGSDIFRIQFNEPRGGTVANTSSNATMPTMLSVSSASWQGDPGPGREYWKGPESGFGALALSAVPGDRCITTGWALAIQGSMTVAWWQRSNGASTALAEAWGGTGGGSVRCYSGGAAGSSLIYSGSTIGDFSALVDLRSSTQWTHVALVVDDQRGFARWYVDGLQTNVMGFLPGAHAAANTGFHIGWHQNPATAYGTYFALDDFNMDRSAYTPAELAVLMLGEQASHSPIDAGCAGTVGIPTITGNTSPILGSTFVVTLDQMLPNSFCGLLIGFFTNTPPIPLDLSAFGAPGCFLSVSPDLSFASFSGPSGSTSFPIPIPIAPLLLHAHVYLQGVGLDPGANSFGLVTTSGLDVLINDC